MTAPLLPGARLKQAWRDGRCTLNGWLAAPDPTVTENMATLDWDSLTIDLQHGMADYAQALRMMIAIQTGGAVPMVRVAWLEEGIIMKLLDAGAHGVICPMTNSPDEVARFVRACRYPPRGIRSFGPIRAKLHGGADYHQHANDAVITIAMIETTRALEQVDAILEVEDLDAVYVGPADLSLDLGEAPGFDSEVPRVIEAIEHVIARARAHDKFVGVHNGSARYALRMAEAGAHFVTVGSDLRFMTTGASAAIAEFRGGASD